MIQYANHHTQTQVRQMWKTVFGDSDAYMDIYFREKYRNEHTLVYLVNDEAVASLQMLPYSFTFCDKEIPAAYISGACTLPEARKKGYMEQLLLKSFEEMAKNNVPLSILVPQEAWLLRFYEKYGYTQTFDAGDEDLPSLKTLLHKHLQDTQEAYREFNVQFRTKDMTVQKTINDFRTIVEEAQLFHFPPKKNLGGMARIIDAKRLLTIFAQKYPHSSFSTRVFDGQLKKNNATFVISNSEVMETSSVVEPTTHTDIRKLTRLLFGYHTSNEEESIRSLFPEKTPQMNYMLE